MNLEEMRNLVRIQLHDEDSENYVWTDDELDSHIGLAVAEFSAAVPLEQKTEKATTSGSRQIDVSAITGLIAVQAVEYPTDRFPVCFRRFSLWNNILTILEPEIPDGSDCRLYYVTPHTIDSESSTFADIYNDIIAAGAAGYAALQAAAYSINRVNTGGTETAWRWAEWGQSKLDYFRSELKRLSKRNRIRVNSLYVPYYPVKSQSTDWGP